MSTIRELIISRARALAARDGTACAAVHVHAAADALVGEVLRERAELMTRPPRDLDDEAPAAIAAEPPPAVMAPGPAAPGQGVQRDAGDPPAAPIADVPIPDGWRALRWSDLRALAARVSDTPIHDKADALAAIEAELARRTEGGS